MKDIWRSKSNEWGTPQDLFDELDKEFDFTLDPCANPSRLLKTGCMMLNISKDMNGLGIRWRNERVYCNPPWTGELFRAFCEKIHAEKDSAEVIVLIAPLRKCGSIYFYDLVLRHAEARFIRGRPDFIPLAGQRKASSNPSGSILLILRKGK